MQGRITRIISNLYTVDVDGKTYDCRARGKFRNDKLIPLVGDYVEINDENYILDIKDRINSLNRPMVANIDVALIVTSLKRPELSSYLLDKMIVNVSSINIKPVLVFTKFDLIPDEEKDYYDSILSYYKSVGYDCLLNTEIDKLDELIDGKVVVLTGQTGVGKSTLLNKLLPDVNQETNDISDALGRGKHTTRHVELFKYKNSFIVDTPGFSALDINEEDENNIRFYFKEFKNDECKFNDCKHINEIGCKIKEDVENGIILQSRYDNYKRMVLGDENININNKG
ncbi:MAG: ribosome small subunit-dependent GTPase A [Bacilli bacterium]|nr:ribosome small subunit-dependent GTPase A [Bacilli bacterium]